MMDDKTRILTEVIRRGLWKWLGTPFRDKQAIPRAGDLVKCETGRSPHDWTISFMEKYSQYGTCVLREIGSQRQCRMENESYSVIDFLDYEDKLEGAQRKFYEKIRKCCAALQGEIDNYGHGLWGVRFRDKTCVVYVRNRWDHGKYHTAATDYNEVFEGYPISIPFVSRASNKLILSQLREGGYGKAESICYSRDTLEPKDRPSIGEMK